MQRSLRQQWAASAAAAAAAIMCRQTNVVWAAFTCGVRCTPTQCQRFDLMWGVCMLLVHVRAGCGAA